MWVVFGRLFATVLYTIVTNCSIIYPVLYPEVHFCLFSRAHWKGGGLRYIWMRIGFLCISFLVRR